MKDEAFKDLMKMSGVPAGEEFTLKLMQRIEAREEERRLVAANLRHRLMVVFPLTLLLLAGTGACVYLLQGPILHLAGGTVMRLCQLLAVVFILFGTRTLIGIRRQSMT